jgi:hypothetical protein
MRRIIRGIGMLAFGSLSLGGLFSLAEYFMPGAYQQGQERGAFVVYGAFGRVYVDSDPKNMLVYLLGEDSDNLKFVLSNIEKDIVNYHRAEARSVFTRW